MRPNWRTSASSREEFGREIEATVASKEGTINELQQRVEALTSELGQSTTELNTLRDSQAEVASARRRMRERMLSNEIQRLKEEEERYKETARVPPERSTGSGRDCCQRTARLRERACQAWGGRQAPAAASVRSTTSSRRSRPPWKAQAESARLSLAQSEQSWEERKQHLERD